MAIFGLAGYVYIRNASLSFAEEQAKEATRIHFESNAFEERVSQKIDQVSADRIEEYVDTTRNYAETLAGLEKFRKEVLEQIEDMAQKISQVDREEDVADVEIKGGPDNGGDT